MGVLETRGELLIVQKLELSIEHPASGATDYELRITNHFRLPLLIAIRWARKLESAASSGSRVLMSL